MWVSPFKSAELEVVPPRKEADARVAVLLNANARKVTPKVVRALSHVVGQGDLFVSRGDLDTRRIAQTVLDRRYQTVFMGGGDGTFMCFANELLNQAAVRSRLHHAPLPRFGVLKLGTGNSVANVVNASSPRGDGILDDVLRARAGEVPGYRTLDLLMVDGRRAPFAGLGMDGKLLNDYIWVKQNFGQGPLKPLLTGAGGYIASVGLKTVPHYLTQTTWVGCEITNGKARAAYRMGPDGTPMGDPVPPGGTIFKGDLMMAAAATIPFYGFGLKMFPFAMKRKGMMNLRFGSMPATQILANLKGLWAGTWLPEGIQDWLCSEATIRFDRPMPFQLGGDAEGYREQLKLGVDQEAVELVDFTGSVH